MSTSKSPPADFAVQMEDTTNKGLTLEWSSVTYTIKVKSGKVFKPEFTDKTILDGVSGVARPGELLSIMGPSGGGKTTLLNALSRRQHITSGKILLNGGKIPS